MKKRFPIVLIVSLISSCATRSMPPAPIMNVTKAPNYLDDSHVSSNSSTNNSENDTELGSMSPNDANSGVVTKDNQPPVKDDKSSQLAQGNSLVAVPEDSSSMWLKPTDGVIVKQFSVVNKGVDYTARVGQSIVAINSGKVVYSGNGLKGYGNLVIIKHDKVYLSAYANNQANLVKEGDIVKSGQQIATMGKGSNNKGVLHFEIRQNGKPINPNLLIKGI